MPKVDCDGVAIHYEVDGPPAAPWLVMSNSLGTDLGFWDAQVRAFGDRFRILRYDTRGHGRSGAPPGDYTFERLGRDVLALMDHAGIDRAGFCGLSMGGTTGLWLAVNAPARFDRMVLANTGAKIGAPESWQQRIDTVLATGMGAIVDAVVDRWFTKRFQEADPQAVARIRAMILRTPPAGYAGCCAALRDADLRGSIDAIDLPMLVVAGAHDAATPPALSDEIAAAVRGARVVTLDAAHLSNIESESDFNAAVGSFFADGA